MTIKRIANIIVYVLLIITIFLTFCLYINQTERKQYAEDNFNYYITQSIGDIKRATSNLKIYNKEYYYNQAIADLSKASMSFRYKGDKFNKADVINIENGYNVPFQLDYIVTWLKISDKRKIIDESKGEIIEYLENIKKNPYDTKTINDFREFIKPRMIIN